MFGPPPNTNICWVCIIEAARQAHWPQRIQVRQALLTNWEVLGPTPPAQAGHSSSRTVKHHSCYTCSKEPREDLPTFPRHRRGGRSAQAWSKEDLPGLLPLNQSVKRAAIMTLINHRRPPPSVTPLVRSGEQPWNGQTRIPPPSGCRHSQWHEPTAAELNTLLLQHAPQMTQEW